jgi:carboxyl-terminal processing protease
MQNRFRLKARLPYKLSLLSFLVVSFLVTSSGANAQTPVIDRGRGKEMLQAIKDTLKEVYYDPNFHGMNVDVRFKEAEKQITEAKSSWQINTIIAQVLADLNDSHTRFWPPELVLGVNFGFAMQMIGDTCYIVHVKPGSDAESKGLKVSHQLFAIDGYEPTRESIDKIIYSYFELLPPPSLQLTVRELDGRLSEIQVAAAVSQKKPNKIKLSGSAAKPPQYYDLSDDVIICKLPEFFLNDGEVDEMMKRIRTRKVLILDLRRNPGGRVDTEQRVLSYFFDHDVKIGDEKGRKKTTTRFTKTRGAEKTFTGKLFVLVDSKSTSAAEVFARVMQLEKRGVVVGDRTGGAVMTAISATFPLRTSVSWQAVPRSFYGASFTIADLIMSDGASLEKTGVIPDVLVLSTGSDLATKRDPVLARAAELAGVKLDAAKAATIFPSDLDVDESKDKSKENQ